MIKDENYCMINSKWTQSQVNFLFGSIMFLTAHLNSSLQIQGSISKIIMWIMSLGQFWPPLTIAPDLLYCWSSDHWTSYGLKSSQMEIILLTTKVTLQFILHAKFQGSDRSCHSWHKQEKLQLDVYHLASGRKFMNLP